MVHDDLDRMIKILSDSLSYKKKVGRFGVAVAARVAQTTHPL